jgi:hypothetical protein
LKCLAFKNAVPTALPVLCNHPPLQSIDGLTNVSRVVTSKLMDFMEEDYEVNEFGVDITSSYPN